MKREDFAAGKQAEAPEDPEIVPGQSWSALVAKDLGWGINSWSIRISSKHPLRDCFICLIRHSFPTANAIQIELTKEEIYKNFEYNPAPPVLLTGVAMPPLPFDNANYLTDGTAISGVAVYAPIGYHLE